MIVRWVTVGPFEENSYLVADEASRRGVLVDPGDEPERILQMVAEADVAIDAIWLTHAHIDHIGAVHRIRRAFPVPVWLHPADLPLYRRGAQSAAMYGVPFEQPDDPDRLLADGARVRFSGHSFAVMHLPGHSPGHVAFVSETMMLGGDVLFAGSIGRTDLPMSNPGQMRQSLARVVTLDPALAVYPGHGPATTIGEEVRTNPFLTAFHAA